MDAPTFRTMSLATSFTSFPMSLQDLESSSFLFAEENALVRLRSCCLESLGWYRESGVEALNERWLHRLAFRNIPVLCNRIAALNAMIFFVRAFERCVPCPFLSTLTAESICLRFACFSSVPSTFGLGRRCLCCDVCNVVVFVLRRDYVSRDVRGEKARHTRASIHTHAINEHTRRDG